MAATRPSRISGKQDRTNMPASNLKIETRIGVKRESRRILSIVSNTTELKGFPVGFFAEEMTRAFLMFRSEEHTSELQSLMRISYAVFCLKKKNYRHTHTS